MTRWHESGEFSTGHFRLWLLLKVYKLFGRRVLKIVIFPVVLSAFVFMKGARKASREYLAVVYEKTGRKDLKPSFFHSFKHIYSFAESLLDKLAGWTGDISEDMLVYENPKGIDSFFGNVRSGKGMFMLCSHLGNIEILRALAADEGRNIAVNAFMDISRTQSFNDFIKKTNPAANMNLYSTSAIGVETAVMTKDKLDNGEIVVMAADRTAAAGDKNSMEKLFMGRPARFPTGAFRFALAMECPICFLAICRNCRGKFSVYLKMHEWRRDLKTPELMDSYVTWLEEIALQHPYQWYNFYSFWINTKGG